ncbi:hypothetical protein KM043_008456 [Ampulex compressa]|nr:hypothetical protein KM043_008456 [Ampulex compressa]
MERDTRGGPLRRQSRPETKKEGERKVPKAPRKGARGWRKTRLDTKLENRGKVVPLQPSKTHRSCWPVSQKRARTPASQRQNTEEREREKAVGSGRREAWTRLGELVVREGRTAPMNGSRNKDGRGSRGTRQEGIETEDREGRAEGEGWRIEEDEVVGQGWRIEVDEVRDKDGGSWRRGRGGWREITERSTGESKSRRREDGGQKVKGQEGSG